MCKEVYESRMKKWREVWSLEGKQRKWRKAADAFAVFCGFIIMMALVLSFGIFQGEYPFGAAWKNVVVLFLLMQASFASGIIPMILVRGKIDKEIARLNVEIKMKLDELRKS